MDTMGNQDKSTFNDHLRERTIQMAATLYWMLKDKKVSWIIRPGVNQIIRSSSSVAANFRAATRACSEEIYSEVDQLVRLFNAIKSKMKLKIGGKKCEI
jgi:hypothetical protein